MTLFFLVPVPLVIRPPLPDHPFPMRTVSILAYQVGPGLYYGVPDLLVGGNGARITSPRIARFRESWANVSPRAPSF